jgi:hypothetical protein
MKNLNMRTIGYWTTTIFGPSSFVIGGALHLTQSEEVVTAMTHLGYPAYFAPILGVGKLLGAVVITAPGLPRLKEWAYAGFFFDLTAAALSRAAVGDGAADILAPLGFLALVLASWALRPEARRLPAANAIRGTERSGPGAVVRRGVGRISPLRAAISTVLAAVAVR